MSFRGEGRSVSTEPFLPRGQKGFFVRFYRPDTGARYARRRFAHHLTTLTALLGCGAAELCARRVLAETPVYETVVVATPTSAEAPREDRAASASVITQDRTPRAAESVPQLLSEQAGATVTRLGGMGSTATVSLRGSTANQVLVYVDGVPYNTATGGGVDLGAIPLGDVERIEIYRGMSPIGFGASAIGGVVSITTAVPSDNRVELESGGGSFGTYYGGARAAWNLRTWHFYSGVHVLSSEGNFPYADSQGTALNPADDVATRRRNNDLHQIDGSAKAVLDLPGDRRLTASVIVFDRHQGLPGTASLANPDARLDTLRATGILAFESNQDSGLFGRLRATAYGNYDLTHFRDLDFQINSSETDAHDRTLTAGATLNWRRLTRPWLILSGVFDARFDRFLPSDTVSTGLSGAPATRLFAASGLEGDVWIQPITLDIIASFRIEAAREDTSGRTLFDKFQPTSGEVTHLLPIPRLSLVKELGAWLALRANGGRYARLPSTIELYGNTGYLQGNPTLVPESGFNGDLGPVVCWKRGTNSLSWSTALFASLADHLIQYQFGNGRARAYNVGSARILGLESSAVLALGGHARLTLAGTFTDARDTSSIPADNGRQLPLRPRYRLYARPEWRALQLSEHTQLGLYADLDITGGNYTDPTNLNRVAPRLLFGAGVYADLPANLSLRLSAQNLGNSPIYDLVNYPLPGREVYVTLAWSSANNKTKD
jgi:iron complex outermembrane receptor protein